MYTCARTWIRIRALILTWNDILNWGIDVDMDVATGCCYVWNHTCGNCYRYGYCESYLLQRFKTSGAKCIWALILTWDHVMEIETGTDVDILLSYRFMLKN